MGGRNRGSRRPRRRRGRGFALQGWLVQARAADVAKKRHRRSTKYNTWSPIGSESKTQRSKMTQHFTLAPYIGVGL